MLSLRANKSIQDLSWRPTVRRHSETSVTGKFSWKITHLVPSYRPPQKQRALVKAVVSSNGDNNKTSKSAEQVQVNQDSESASKSTSKDGIDVKAVITIRKKLKEKLSEKIEDQWESFIIGIGQGILIQLISQDIDPG